MFLLGFMFFDDVVLEIFELFFQTNVLQDLVFEMGLQLGYNFFGFSFVLLILLFQCDVLTLLRLELLLAVYIFLLHLL